MLYYYNGKWQVNYENDKLKTDYKTDYPKSQTSPGKTVYSPKGQPIFVPGISIPLPDNVAKNKINAKKNADNNAANKIANDKNAIYNKVLQTATNTKGGDYLQQKNNLKTIEDEAKKATFKQEDIDSLFNSYNTFYKNEKIGTGWNIDLGAKPPAGTFDASYYLTENPQVKATWDDAVKAGDLDITEQYKNANTYALYNYTWVGKPAGKRGNKAEELKAAKEYIEKKPTDAEIQGLKEKQLGISYEALKSSTPGTQLEEIASTSLGADIVKKTKQFGALTQAVLKNTVKEMQKAKAKEQLLSMMGGLSGFQELLNINETLSDSILGDSGVGGILAVTSGKKAEEGLQTALTKMSGVNTSTVYNWQQWFDNNLKKQYEKDLELGLTTKEAKEQINIEANFAKDFIEQYLVPRFNQSQTISEFIEYVDVEDKNQNPFQTQDVLNAAAEVGAAQAQTYLDQIKSIQNAYFNADFYFNPNANLKSEEVKQLVGSKQQEESYKKQAEIVSADWEDAKQQYKAQNGYWYAKAYQYGVDPTDKEAFAKLHFQVKGQSQGFDAAGDLWTPAKVQDYIYSTILPAIKDKAGKMSIFGEFIKPTEFADNLLSSAKVNPNDKSTWGDVLKTFGLDTFAGSYDDLKGYIANTFKTVSAADVSKQIEELQKKGVKPSQKNLGVFYIEKPTDTAGSPEGETALYKTFKKYGYSGDEGEFYQKFFPDLDYEEQKLLTKAGGKAGDLKFTGLSTKNPIASLSAIEKLMGSSDDGISGIFSLSDKTEKTPQSYFKLGLEDEKDIYKPKSGASILGEFTSLFKGF